LQGLKVEPEKPYSGHITLRTTPEERTLLLEAAFKSGNRSLNEWMNTVLIHEAERRIHLLKYACLKFPRKSLREFCATEL
jgi:uncharacterized protein (DUF1778 family)